MIILTGGAGFIGSCFLKILNKNGIDDIIVVDRLGTGEKWKNLIGKKYSSYIHKDDFRKKLSENTLPDNIEAIIHLGACTVTTEKDADYLIDNNFNYSVELANFAIKNNIRFIYASSAATYGDGNEGYSDNTFENLKPLNMYGYSKHAFDEWVIKNEYHKIFTGFKFFNVFGPNEYHKDEMASMVFKSFNQIKKTGRVRLFKSDVEGYSDGEQKRDFIYVKDVVAVLWNALNTPEFSGIYNLGTGNADTWNHLIECVFDAMNLKANIEYIDMPISLTGQYQYFTEAVMDNFNNSLCKISFQSIESSIEDYVQNHLLLNWKFF